MKQKIKMLPGRGCDCYTMVSVAIDSISDLAHKNNVDIKTKIYKKGKGALAILEGDNRAVHEVVSSSMGLSRRVFSWKKCLF